MLKHHFGYPELKLFELFLNTVGMAILCFLSQQE